MRWLLGDKGRTRGFLPDEIPLRWRLIGEEIVMLVGDSGTWPDIAEIGGREEEWQKGGD